MNGETHFALSSFVDMRAVTGVELALYISTLTGMVAIAELQVNQTKLSINFIGKRFQATPMQI